MTAISISVNRGFANASASNPPIFNPGEFVLGNYTVGTNAPSANDIEIRWNTTDANGNDLTKKDVWLALTELAKVILSGGATVNLVNTPAI
jgi:hypothetical protein